MCRNCRRVLGIHAPKFRLREHVIRYKQFGRMHFDDCQCGECHLEGEQSSVFE